MPSEARSALQSPVALSVPQALTVIDSVVCDAEVKVFGSRATGRARPFSDLDLLFVHPPQLSWQQRAELRDRFESSELPFRVDLVEVCALAPGMAERVASESVELPRA